MPVMLLFSPSLSSRGFYSIQQILRARYHDMYWAMKISRASSGLGILTVYRLQREMHVPL